MILKRKTEKGGIEMGTKKSLRKWVAENRDEIDRYLEMVGNRVRVNDSDRMEWVQNDEVLYNWARGEGVNV